MLDRRWRGGVERTLGPLGERLRRIGISADALTVFGLLCSAATAVLIASGHLGWAVVGVIVSGVADLLDGAIARGSGQASPRGAFFDSVSDRVSDALLLGGTAWYLAGESAHLPVLAFAVGATSMLISYERARAEALGINARGGLMERAERFVFLSFAFAFSRFLVPVLWIMLVLTIFTAADRFRRVYRQADRPQPVHTRRRRTVPDGESRAALREWWAARRNDAGGAARRRHRSPRRSARPYAVPSLRGSAVALTYRFATGLAQVVPPAIGLRLAHVGGRVAYAQMRGRRAMVARHQRRVSGAASNGAVSGAFDSYARYWYEMLRLPADVHARVVDDNFECEGFDHLERALAAGKGAIIALPHLGGWEYAAAWAANRGLRMLAVVEDIEPPELFDWFVEQRRQLGLDIVALGPDASAQILRALRDNRVVALLSDRDLTGDGVEVSFFGEKTTLPGGPATLALRTGATLMAVAVYFRPGRHHHAVIRPPIPVERKARLREDIARITQALAYEFEELIRAAPEQWHLMQPNWPSDREPI
jgi:KDO2-lipid IV(A) lauroyltransferase